jgi:hypothetical protein
MARRQHSAIDRLLLLSSRIGTPFLKDLNMHLLVVTAAAVVVLIVVANSPFGETRLKTLIKILCL